jgi:L-aspartate oxidase
VESALPECVDLLIIGSGVAGLYAALAAGDANALLVSKGPLLSSATYLAQGGVAAAVGPDDRSRGWALC